MPRNYTKTKKWTITTVVAISVAAAVYTLGCSGSGGGSSSTLCNVPLEASLDTQTRIGGATTSLALFSSDGSEWTLFNIANELRAMKVGASESPVGLEVEGFIRDIELVTREDGSRYALLAMGEEGIAVVNVTDPAAMVLETEVKVNYEHTGINWTEGGGDIVYDNSISSTRGPVSSLAVYDEGNATVPSPQLLIGDAGYGLHKTALNNLFDTVNGREADGTLLIDGPEAYTLQYAGENPWGGPKSLKLYGEGNNTRLFVAQGYLGMGIYDPKTLEQVGRYNLYADATEDNRGEDWFIDMDVATAVQSGNLDACTGMPDYKQASFEILSVWHGDVNASTPWADFDRYGKFYYDARKIDVATFSGGGGADKTIAYIAYGLGGLVAVDVTGYDSATPRDINCTTSTGFLEGKFLGYAPAVPAHGADEMTGEESKSLFPYFGAGMLKEAGVVDVKVDLSTNQVYFSDHFAGLMVLGNANHPEAQWHGPDGFDGYNNDEPGGTLGDHWPDYEFVTSYDMTPVPLGEEEVPKYIFEAPVLLHTGEVSGHGNSLLLTSTFDPVAFNGETDVVLAAGGGGLNFIDVLVAGAQENNDFNVSVHIPTTDEIGAYPDGTPVQEINIGHAEGVTAYGNLLFLADGPHGMSVWKIADDRCNATDNVHLVANTLQDEYPVDVNGTTINPAPHAHDVVLDIGTKTALVMSQSRGVRRIDVSDTGSVNAPVLLYPKETDIFEHNRDEGNVADFLHMQDHAYGAAIKGTLAFVADGSNGLTVYDLSKDPTDANNTNGYVVSNIGGDTNSQPDLGRASDVALWSDKQTGKEYAFVCAGSRGVGVVDVTDVKNMKLIKVFEPIKMEDDKVGKADGKSVAVKVVRNHAFFTYDSFGIVSYSIADLIAPLIEGTDPTDIWKTGGVDQRPVAAARFKLQDPTMFGSADLAGWSGGAAGMDVVQTYLGRDYIYVAYGDAGVIKIDWTNPASPVLVQHANTVGFAGDVIVRNGRVYVADGGGGLALLK